MKVENVNAVIAALKKAASKYGRKEVSVVVGYHAIYA